MIAVLTAINIADQYLKIKVNFEEIKRELEQSQLKIGELEKHVETLHAQLNKEKTKHILILKKNRRD